MKYEVKGYKDLRKISKKIVKLVVKTDKDLNKILSMIDKSKDLFPNQTEFRNAFKDEFLATLSERIAGKLLVDACI